MTSMRKFQGQSWRKHGQSTNSKGCGRQPGTKDLLNYKGILAGRANGPDRHWVGWGAAIVSEALDGARASPTATLRPRATILWCEYGPLARPWRNRGVPLARRPTARNPRRR